MQGDELDRVIAGNFMFIAMPAMIFALFAMSMCAIPDDDQSPMLGKEPETNNG